MLKKHKSGIRSLGGEVSRFGAVGAIGWVVDTAIFNLCLHVLGLQSVRSGVLASAVAIIVNYAGNRKWTYGSRSSSRRMREAFLFIVFSVAGTVIQNSILAISHYGMDNTSLLADNVAKNVVGLALATVFRFFAYRAWVFPKAAQRQDGQEAEFSRISSPSRIGAQPAPGDVAAHPAETH
ncbi:GtrA family protein [Streptomyces sp. NPDC090303]|uniref:GtrA family protein n=1 Tax=Streptomyces sp. NPDC090303 TaxID=3365960 RepID=UPI00380543B3